MGMFRRGGALVFAGSMLLVAMSPDIVVSAAAAGSPDHARDEFNAISYSGSDGTVAWEGEWLETPLTNGPEEGQIRVVSDSRCVATYCLRFGPDNVTGRGAYRAVDLGGATSARLTFSSRRFVDDDGEGGRLNVAISNDGWSWSPVAEYSLNRNDAEDVPRSIDLSAWAGTRIKVGFFGTGDFDGYFFIDDVDVSMSSNAPPVFDEGLVARGDSEGATVSVSPQVSDPDSASLSFSAVGLPAGVSINSHTGVISGTIAYTAASASPYTTVVSVSDGDGGVATSSFVWSVANSNRAPTLAAISDRNVNELTTMSVTVVASDPDLPYESLRFTLSTAPTGAAINQSGVVSWTPSESRGPGTYTFSVRVEDAASPPATATRSFDVSVAEVNSPPAIEYIPDQSLGAGDHLSLPVTATDTDIPANTVTFSATGLPPGVTINSSTGRISGTIPSSTAQVSGTATVTARDNGVPPAQSVRTFSWQVTDGNRAPILDPISEQHPNPSGLVSFTASASDGDAADSLSYWLAAGIDPVPEGASINASSGQFTWSPTDAQHGTTYRINVGVSDSGSPRLSDTQLVTIVIPKLNAPPQVSTMVDQRSAEGESISVQVGATDPDPSDNLRFRATGLPAGLRISPTTGVISGEIEYTAAAESPYSVQVTVSDDGFPVKSTSTSFEWIVDETNRPPVVAATALVAIVGEPAQVVIDATDPDGDDLVFSVVDAPVFGSLDGDFPNLTYTSTGGSSDQFAFEVSDGEFDVPGLVAIEIRASNGPPVAGLDEYHVAAGTDLRVAAPGVLGNDEDPDGETLTAVLVAAPDHGELSLNSDGSFTYVPEAGYVGGDKFTYAAVDGLGERATATVVLTVGEPTAAVVPIAEDSIRGDVIAATVATWQPPVIEDSAVTSEIRRAVVASVHAGISTVPDLSYPLLLLAVALVLALTLGRISLLPFTAGKTQEEGSVGAFDELYGFGRLVPDDQGEEVFVHGRALDPAETLSPGQRVEFIAATIRGRRIALKVWPAS